MRKGKDGLPFDIDNFDELNKGEVEIIQFLRPEGRRRRMAAYVGEEMVNLAKKQILSTEQLTTGEIAVYSRLIGEKKENEICEIADNGAGDSSPTNMLIKVITKKNGDKQ